MNRKAMTKILRGIHVYKDIIAGSVLFVSFALFMLSSMKIKQSSLNVIGSAFMPKLISGIMLVVSALIIVQGIMSIPKSKGSVPEYTEEYLLEISKRTRGIVLSLLLLLVTIIVLRFLGFIVAGILFMFCQITLLTLKEERNYKMIVIQSVFVTVAVYFIFRYGFSIMLPMGIFA